MSYIGFKCFLRFNFMTIFYSNISNTPLKITKARFYGISAF